MLPTRVYEKPYYPFKYTHCVNSGKLDGLLMLLNYAVYNLNRGT